MNKFILIFLFISSLTFADSVFIRVTSNNETLSNELRVYIISELTERDYTISTDRYEADWVFESEIIQTGEEILLAYLIFIDSRSRNIFYEEFILHTWVSFYQDNYQRASTFFIDEFDRILEEL